MRLPDGSSNGLDAADDSIDGTSIGLTDGLADPSDAGPGVADASKQLKTGTTTVGISAEDGVVLATDQRASLDGMIADKGAKKIYEVHPTAALTIAGGVSAAQSLVSTLQAETRLYETRRGKDMSIQAVSTMTGNLLRSGNFRIVIPVLGGVDDEGPHVYSYDAVGGLSEQEYTVSGSGSEYAFGVLDQHYEESLPLGEARDIAVDAIKAGIGRDVASGNGVRVAEVTADGVEAQVYDDVEEL